MVPLCPCGSGLSYVTCCGLRHNGRKPAETAEALMRSRYSAYVMGLGDYLVATQAPSAGTHSAEALAEWSRRVKWLGLKVLRVERGREKDARGTVEFEATFEEDGKLVTQREVSRFDRVGGRWRYLDGKASRRSGVGPTTAS